MRRCPLGQLDRRSSAWPAAGRARVASLPAAGGPAALDTATATAWALLTGFLVLPPSLFVVVAVSSLSFFLWSGGRRIGPVARSVTEHMNRTPRRAR